MYFFLLVLMTLFSSCISVPPENLGVQIYQSQEEKMFLDSLQLFEKKYIEVLPGVSKWVSVNKITEYEYNLSNQLIKETSFFDEIIYEYDERGNKICEKKKLGNSVTFKYDENNYLTNCYFSNNYWVSYTNDKFGNHIYSIDSESKERYFEFDNFNRLIHVNNIGEDEFFYEYVSDSWTSDSDKSKTYSAKISNNKNKNQSYCYFDDGLEIGYAIMKYIDSHDSYIYIYQRKNEYNQFKKLVHQVDSINGDVWFAYVYDDNGNVIKCIEFVPM